MSDPALPTSAPPDDKPECIFDDDDYPGDELAIECCRSGSAPACVHQMLIIEAGSPRVMSQVPDGGPIFDHVPNEMRNALTDECERGDVDACAAVLLEAGPIDDSRQELLDVCRRGSSFGCWMLGNRFPSAGNGQLDSLRQGCELKTLGWGAACQDYARLLVRLTDDEDRYEKAARLLEQACSHYPPACPDLAGEYLRGGRGVRRNPSKAYELYTRACEVRVERACKGKHDMERMGDVPHSE